ncbi:MAG: glucokinase [Icmadophila ericetorum]|nr:glucokinase [Icmadophila ericetorum]
MVASAAELFSFITSHIEAFLKTHHSDCFNPSETKRPFSLGLVFSYPVYQNAINQGILLRWTKGFDIPDVVGQDVCKLLQNELDLRNLPVRVTALVNDAAGTIMSRAYSLPLSKTRTSIGAIFGTGTNGVYLEKLSKITKPLDGHYDTSTGEMFISVEWGSFNNHLSVLPNTPYDAELNAVSVNPGNQMFEKRVSGMFLGELLRTITLEMHMDPNFKLFQVLDSHTALADEERLAFFTRWAVDSSLLSAAEADSSDGLKTLREKIAESFGLPIAVISLEDAQVVKIIANAIGRRAARLAGMAIGAVVLQSGRLNDPVTPLTAGTETKQWLSIDKSLSRNAPTPTPEEGDGYGDDFREFEIVDVGVDGSLIEFYPGFEAYMREALRAIAGIGTAGEKRVRIGIAKDGSSVGAAIIALLAGEQLRNDGN